MVDIQSPTAEIKRGKKKIEITGQKYSGGHNKLMVKLPTTEK